MATASLAPDYTTGILTSEASAAAPDFDVVVVGAGFAGMYMLYRLRQLGLRARVFEAGDGVGGTWYWNRYPGARCDADSVEYSYSFSEELQREWKWTERFATQPEILRYANHVADEFDLRPDIQFNTRVTAATFDEQANRWTVQTTVQNNPGQAVTAQFCIMATGCLSTWRMPDFKGRDSFRGEVYHTGNWPHEGVDLSGKRVAVIGTGSSGIQSIPVMAEQAEQLLVFQRTPNFSVPAKNAPLSEDYQQWVKDNYATIRQKARASWGGAGIAGFGTQSALAVSAEERQREYQRRWDDGGAVFMGTFSDLISNKEANDTAADFVRQQIKSIVHDPAVAAQLMPTDHPLGTKRICVDTDYWATFNRPNVQLVNVKNNPIEEITPAGVRTAEQEYEVDVIVFATGFDAMTGALLNMDIRGAQGQPLRTKWADGPRMYLGLMTAGFPNLFTITGPGSPSVLSNMMTSIEQHVEWIADCLAYLRAHGETRMEATPEAEDTWVEHVNQVADYTLFPQANSWYMGANIPGKPRVFMPYVGGVGPYRQKCDAVAAAGYEGFRLTNPAAPVMA